MGSNPFESSIFFQTCLTAMVIHRLSVSLVACLFACSLTCLAVCFFSCLPFCVCVCVLTKDEWKYLRLAGRMRWLYFRCTMKPLAQKPGQGPRLSALQCPPCSCKGNCWRYDRKWQYLWKMKKQRKNKQTNKQTKAWMARVVSLFILRRHCYCSTLRLLARTQWLFRGFLGYLLWLQDGYHIWSRRNG